MSRVNGIKYTEDTSGYYVRDPKKLEQIEANEDYIIKGGLVKDAKVATDKFVKGIFVYPKKGLKGSKNSNFYEFLTMTAVPTLAGSATMIALYNLLRGKGVRDFSQVIKGNQVAASVVLYAVGKWIGNKAVNAGTKALTGVDLDMTYKSYKSKLPEFNGDKNLISEEFHKVYESVDFPRWDIINKEGMKNGNKYEYYDKIAKKMGVKETLNAPDQEIQPKIKKVVTKARAASSISQYLWAALGVCIGSHFGTPNDSGMGLIKTIKTNLKINKNLKDPNITEQAKEGIKLLKKDLWPDYFKRLAKTPQNLFARLKAACREFYQGTAAGKTLSADHIKKNKIFAYTLTGLAFGTTILGILNTKIGFKIKEDDKVINTNKPWTEA